MPHADIKCSADLSFDTKATLQRIEAIINDLDPSAGACKGRAYPAEIFHHTHILVEVSLLPKPHRDQAFMQSLSQALEADIKSQLTQACKFSLALNFSDENYVTNEFTPD